MELDRYWCSLASQSSTCMSSHRKGPVPRLSQPGNVYSSAKGPTTSAPYLDGFGHGLGPQVLYNRLKTTLFAAH